MKYNIGDLFRDDFGSESYIGVVIETDTTSNLYTILWHDRTKRWKRYLTEEDIDLSVNKELLKHFPVK
jgi:hypothetical protein